MIALASWRSQFKSTLLHPRQLRLCARYRLPLRWHTLTLTCNDATLSQVMLCAIASDALRCRKYCAGVALVRYRGQAPCSLS